MKKTIFLVSMIILCSITYAQIKINSSGQVGIGGNPTSYRLTVMGGLYYYNCDARFYHSYNDLFIDQTGYYGMCIRPESNYSCSLGKTNLRFRETYTQYLYTGSDAREKENIKDIEGALDKVLQLKGVRYDLKKEYAYNDAIIKDEKIREKLEEDRKNQIGFLAQDVNLILPEVVGYNDSTDVYCIDYTKVVPILAEAIKEQQAMIEDLKAKINKKNADVIPGEKDGDMGIDEPYLEQNVPNPFSEATAINFYLPNEAGNVLLNIYDMQGLQIKSYDIIERGYSSIIINASELQPGMYLYTLIMDEKEVDTKRMILTN